MQMMLKIILVAEGLKRLSTCGGTTVRGPVHVVRNILSYFVQIVLMHSTWRCPTSMLFSKHCPLPENHKDPAA